MAIQEITKPPMLDETGQDMVTKLQAIANNINNNAGQIDYSNTTSQLQATKVQTAIDEVKGITDTISASLTQLQAKIHTDSKSCAINASGLVNLTDAFSLPANAYDITCEVDNNTCFVSSVTKWTNGNWYVTVFELSGSTDLIRRVTGSVTLKCTWRTP